MKADILIVEIRPCHVFEKNKVDKSGMNSFFPVIHMPLVSDDMYFYGPSMRINLTHIDTHFK